MIHDKDNMKRFREGKTLFYCNICHSRVDYDNSVSSKGWHLICTQCAYRIGDLLGMSYGDVIIRIHDEAERLHIHPQVKVIKLEEE